MPEKIPGFRSRFRFVKWLGYETVQRSPLVRMLHDARAQAAAREKTEPLKERKSYQIRQQRIYSRGRIPPDPNAPTAAPADGAAAPSLIAAVEDPALAEALAIANAEASESPPASEP
jgi:hypothetical protein